MCITICGRFRLNEGGVVGYGNRMKAKYTANWGVQIVGMIFQTRSKAPFYLLGVSDLLFVLNRKLQILSTSVSSNPTIRGGGFEKLNRSIIFCL